LNLRHMGRSVAFDPMHHEPATWRRVLDLLAPCEPVVVYLFGSRAHGRSRQDSDMDLAVLPGRSLQPMAWFDLQGRLGEELGVDVDLVNLAEASAVLRKEILAGGKVVWARDLQQRAEWEMYALSDYARLNEERAPVLAALGQPLAGHAR
jgi:predicted nucleotidyltransferase